MIKIKIKEKDKRGFSLFIPIWANLYGSLCTFAYKKYLQSPSEEEEPEEFEVDLEDCELQKELEIKMQADFNQQGASKSKGEQEPRAKECATEQTDNSESKACENKQDKKQPKKPLTEEQIEQAKEIGKLVKIALKELKKFCRKNGKIILVDVQSQDGMSVTISAK